MIPHVNCKYLKILNSEKLVHTEPNDRTKRKKEKREKKATEDCYTPGLNLPHEEVNHAEQYLLKILPHIGPSKLSAKQKQTRNGILEKLKS